MGRVGVNGDDNVVPLQQTKLLRDAVLRRMDHREWLVQFGQLLELSYEKRASPMTPMRAGTIGRLRMAAEYIALLQAEARDNLRHIAVLEDEIKHLKLDLHQQEDR